MTDEDMTVKVTTLFSDHSGVRVSVRVSHSATLRLSFTRIDMTVKVTSLSVKVTTLSVKVTTLFSHRSTMTNS